MPFAGFTVLFMMCRRVLGGTSTPFDICATCNFMLISFVLVSAGLLPSLLASFFTSQVTLWRVANGVILIPFAVFVATFSHRRRKKMKAKNSIPITKQPVDLVMTITFLSL